MASKETLEDYQKRTASLSNLFLDNCLKIKDMVVKDSPVDYATHIFVCSIYISAIRSSNLFLGFWCYLNSSKRDYMEEREFIEKFHSLEKELAYQNEILEKCSHGYASRTDFIYDFIRRRLRELGYLM